jgi:hypothetical protein
MAGPMLCTLTIFDEGRAKMQQQRRLAPGGDRLRKQRRHA